MAAPAALVALVQPWADLYSNNKVVSNPVMFVHLGGLLLGGGGAVAADRDTIRNSRTSEAEQACHLADLRLGPRIALTGLVLTFPRRPLHVAPHRPHRPGPHIPERPAHARRRPGNPPRARRVLGQDGADRAPA